MVVIDSAHTSKEEKGCRLQARTYTHSHAHTFTHSHTRYSPPSCPIYDLLSPSSSYNPPLLSSPSTYNWANDGEFDEEGADIEVADVPAEKHKKAVKQCREPIYSRAEQHIRSHRAEHKELCPDDQEVAHVRSGLCDCVLDCIESRLELQC